MGWMKTCPVHQRMRFVVLVENQEHTFAELCRHFGVSRKTGYKWLARYRAEGQPREHDDAVIALLSVQRDVLIAQSPETLLRKLVVRAFRLLQAQHVGLHGAQKLEHAVDAQPHRIHIPVAIVSRMRGNIGRATHRRMRL
jgi:transposase-like protein